jgi:hypothetical protein
MVQTSNSRKLTKKKGPKTKNSVKIRVFFFQFCDVKKLLIFPTKLLFFHIDTVKQKIPTFPATKATKFVSKKQMVEM